MANREISQFATMAAGAQSSTMYLPIVDTSLGHVALANQKITLNSLFFDLGANTSDGATGMSGLLAAPSAAAAGKLKWYYNNSTKLWLASIDTGAYFSVQRSIAAGLTAGWLPYVDTGGILNGSANATLDSNGQIGCKFLNLTSNAAGLNSVAEINDSTSVDRWEIRLGASNQLIINDVQNSKDVLSLTPGATPVISLTGTLRFATDNSFDFGLVSSGRVRTIYAGTSIFIGRANNQTGQLTLYNSTNSNTTTLQAGAAAASRTYTWPTDFGAAGSVLTDAAGNGTLSWTAAAGITGSIAATQVAYGSGANTITGTSGFTFTSTGLTIQQAAYQRFYIYSTGSSSDFTVQSDTANANAFLQGRYSYLYFYSGTAGVVTQKWQQYMLDADNALRFYNLINSQTHMTLNPSTSPDNSSTSFNSRIVIGTTSSVGSGGQVDVTLTSASRIGQIIKLAAAQSASASQIQNSGGTVIQDFNSGGMLTIGTASTNLDRAIWVKSPGYDTSTGLMGFYAGFTAPSTATAYIYNYNSTILTAAAAYTLTSAMNFIASSPVIGAGSGITTAYAFYAGKQKVTGVTTGYGIYQSDSADLNYFAGNVGIGQVLTNVSLRINIGYTDLAGATHISTTGNITASSGTLSGASGIAVLPIFRSVAQTITTINGYQGYLYLRPEMTNTGDIASSESDCYFAQPRIYGAGSTKGTYTAVSGLRVYQPACDLAGTYVFTTNAGIWVDNVGTPSGSAGLTVTSAVGVLIAGVSGATNNTNLLIGTTSAPSGSFSIYNSSTNTNYLAGVLRVQLTSTVGVLSLGGASASGAYIALSTSSQAANDKLISSAMVGSITGTLYAADISATATVNVLTRITNTENATATSNCELQLVTGGASGGDPFIHFNISGTTDWSIGADNSDSDKLVISASSALGTSNALTITTAGLVTFAGSIVITGKQKNLTVSTGAGSALLGANSPAATLTAPFEWINVTLSDGTTGYVPAWK